MGTTAYERFWQAVQNDRLPATIPIRMGKNVGALTSSVVFRGIEAAEDMVFHDCGKVRAAAALFAILHARIAAKSVSPEMELDEVRLKR